MIRGGDVSFSYELELPADENGDIFYEIVEVSATISDSDPGCISGPPERCYPPEGGEVEDLTVTFPDGTTMDSIPEKLLWKLEERAREQHCG